MCSRFLFDVSTYQGTNLILMLMTPAAPKTLTPALVGLSLSTSFWPRKHKKDMCLVFCSLTTLLAIFSSYLSSVLFFGNMVGRIQFIFFFAVQMLISRTNHAFVNGAGDQVFLNCARTGLIGERSWVGQDTLKCTMLSRES